MWACMMPGPTCVHDGRPRMPTTDTHDLGRLDAYGCPRTSTRIHKMVAHTLRHGYPPRCDVESHAHYIWATTYTAFGHPPRCDLGGHIQCDVGLQERVVELHAFATWADLDNHVVCGGPPRSFRDSHMFRWSSTKIYGLPYVACGHPGILGGRPQGFVDVQPLLWESTEVPGCPLRCVVSHILAWSPTPLLLAPTFVPGCPRAALDAQVCLVESHAHFLVAHAQVMDSQSCCVDVQDWLLRSAVLWMPTFCDGFPRISFGSPQYFVDCHELCLVAHEVLWEATCIVWAPISLVVEARGPLGNAVKSHVFPK